MIQINPSSNTCNTIASIIIIFDILSFPLFLSSCYCLYVKNLITDDSAGSRGNFQWYTEIIFGILAAAATIFIFIFWIAYFCIKNQNNSNKYIRYLGYLRCTKYINLFFYILALVGAYGYYSELMEVLEKCMFSYGRECGESDEKEAEVLMKETEYQNCLAPLAIIAFLITFNISVALNHILYNQEYDNKEANHLNNAQD